MRLTGWIGSVVLVCSTAFVSAETLEIKGPDNILDGFISITYSYHNFDSSCVEFREYWRDDGTYDVRAFFRIDLSAISEGTVIDSAAFKLKVEATTSNSSPLGVDLWQVSPFTEGVTATTCDGTNPWLNGDYDGVDGFYRSPEDRILATTPINADMIDSWVDFSSSKLTDYVQAQADLPVGERYAYFQMSWPEETCDYWGAFYSSQADEASLPYLEISWGGGSTGFPGDANNDGVVDVGDLGILAGNYGTLSGATWAMGDFNGDGAVDVGDLGILAGKYGQSAAASVPEPATLSLLGMGLFALLRRKR